MLTPSDITATIGAGLTTAEAASMLRCATRTVRRAAHAYGIELPLRPAILRGAEQFQAAVDQHGPGLCKIARALDIDRKWLSRQLDRYGIDPGVGTPGRRPSNGEAP